ncbi:DpnD/PcfM family protein [Clostridium sp.]|uniref:DpnD/PcfM family protein n=1 Tax=Clostridium sp. TaxID=1506 RepID=UPI003F3E9B5F
MKKYNFLIEETLGRLVTIEAEDKGSAEAIIDEMYRNSEIILTADDFSGYSITNESEE